MNTASLWWGLLFGSIGLGYFMYGRRQGASVPLLCGLELMAFPCFVSNNWAMALIGAGLATSP